MKTVEEKTQELLDTMNKQDSKPSEIAETCMMFTVSILNTMEKHIGLEKASILRERFVGVIQVQVAEKEVDIEES